MTNTCVRYAQLRRLLAVLFLAVLVAPCVWGQVVEDRGYLPGQCSHAYRSVMFEARAEFVADLEEKRRARGL